MNLRLPTFVRTTTFRLAMLYGVLFTVFSAILLGYLYVSTVGYIRTQTAEQIKSEMAQLENAYMAGGLTRLNQSLLERAATPGRAFFYQLEDPSGKKISGHLGRMPAEGRRIETRGEVTFDMEVAIPGGQVELINVEGEVLRLPDNSTLLVGYITRQRGEIVRRITRAVWTAAPIGLLLSLIGGILISRTAASRAEALAETAEAVMGGDLSRRAPMFNTGDEFDRLAGRMNAMLERIERLMESARDTGNAIAHDLRTPLSRLRNKIEGSLQQDLGADKARETLEDTILEVDGVLNTFNAILRLSRLEAGEGGRLERLSVSEVAEEIAELYEPACEEAGLAFTSKIAPNLFIRGDEGLLAQALSNLLDNAIKYTPQGIIRLEVRAGRDSDIVLSVIDSGPGIPEAKREKAKSRFARLDEARTLPGSGLGLTLVEAAAELHEGKLFLLDGDGPPERPGLRAQLRIPRAK